MNFAKLCALLAIVASGLTSGCASYGPWYDIQPEDVSGQHRYPWCAPGQALKAQGRTINSPFATTNETRYLACTKGGFDLPEEVHAIESRLVNSQVGAGWKKNIFGKIEMPFDVVLASVTPTVLVLCEREEKGQSNRYPGAFDSKLLERGIGYGPVLLCKNPTAWMGEQFEIQALQSINSRTKIAKFPDGLLEITAEGSAWSIQRK